MQIIYVRTNTFNWRLPKSEKVVAERPPFPLVLERVIQADMFDRSIEGPP